MKNLEDSKENGKRIIGELKKTLNPEKSRCFVDAFLIHKQNLEVRYPDCTDPQSLGTDEDSPTSITHFF